MRNLTAGAAALAAAGLVLAPVVSAAAAAGPRADLRGGAVFVQRNGGAGNSIEAFARAADGSLTRVGTFPTGGSGGKEKNAPVDALASQGSLAQAAGGQLLIAVNAGSDTVSSLRVGSEDLQTTSVVGSRGDFPSSVAVHGSLVYVLNAGGTGSVSGYRITDQQLQPIDGAVQSLGLTNDEVPLFITSPAQVGFSPDGRTLVVTTKLHNTIVTFPVRGDGTLGAAITTTSQGPVPFSFVFDRSGNLEVQQAGDGRTASYAVNADSSLTPLGVSGQSGGVALCWSVRVGSFLYGANAGSASLTSWRIASDGTTTVSSPIAASTSPGVIDLAASDGGRYVYALSALAGTVQGFAPDGAGGLTPLGTVTGLPTIDATGGPEGIVAS